MLTESKVPLVTLTLLRSFVLSDLIFKVNCFN